MHILIFGNSDTQGTFLPPGEPPFPALIAGELERRTGERPRITDVALAGIPGAGAYVERRLRQYEPDLVIACLSAHLFVERTINARMRQRLPGPLFRPYLTVVNAWKAASARAGGPGKTLDRLVRERVRGYTGTVPGVDPLVIRQGYLEALDQLGRQEDLPVVLSSASHHSRAVQRAAGPGMIPDVRAFNAALQRRAERLHMQWVDFETALAASGNRDACYMADGIHKSPFGQRALARAFLPAVLRALEMEPQGAVL